jgi:hypothetical protein
MSRERELLKECYSVISCYAPDAEGTELYDLCQRITETLAQPETDEYAELCTEIERLKTLVESYKLGSATIGGEHE